MFVYNFGGFILKIKTKMETKKDLKVAYFSMEFAVDHRIPNYAGGLGVLAADYMYAMADKQFSGIGVSLIYHQDDNPRKAFQPEAFMKKLDTTVTVRIEDRDVSVGVYEYTVEGQDGKTAPIYFLTTNLPENPHWDRDITKNLYPGGASYTRIAQEAILGVGGVRMLRALGYENVEYFHMNEGHAGFLTLELLKERDFNDDAVRAAARFTTHTPVPAGHDHFDYDHAHHILGDMIPWHIRRLATEHDLSMTHLAISLSAKINSVSEKHREVCWGMFPGVHFENVTNGVHHVRWASVHTQNTLDKYLPEWRKNPAVLENVKTKLPTTAVKTMHGKNKKDLVSWINKNPQFFSYDSPLMEDDLFDTDTLTIGFARRFVPYKRTALIFRDLEKLRALGYKKIQLIFAGPVHENNHFAHSIVHKLREYSQALRGQVKVAVIPEYNTHISHHMISGSDVWLNNPIIPREASGTSGMKAALNGGLNLSIPDGWWIEGQAMEPMSGWSFGGADNFSGDSNRDDLDAASLYEVLEDVMSCYYERPKEWAERMKSAMSLLRYFSADRAIDEYDERLWSE